MTDPLKHDLWFQLETAAKPIQTAAERVREIVLESLKPFDLTPYQYCALLMLGQGSLMQSELRERLNLQPNSVCNETNELEDRKLVRKRRNPSNRRQQIIEIEDKGLKLMLRARAEVERAYSELLSAPGARREMLLQFLPDLEVNDLEHQQAASY